MGQVRGPQEEQEGEVGPGILGSPPLDLTLGREGAKAASKAGGSGKKKAKEVGSLRLEVGQGRALEVGAVAGGAKHTGP
ncbi:hypothetical protein NDU88_007399 [Pleurodeles waltl]|uniref:Uncharacterized protein n=1 Tax=Pleurodeles waltl TaxID=8319 RepID=A0AAV7PTH1_PLEWA|nr:hypothetical protein NDU88_007399 [Pleurodeles waltl]